MSIADIVGNHFIEVFFFLVVFGSILGILATDLWFPAIQAALRIGPFSWCGPQVGPVLGKPLIEPFLFK